MKKLINNKLMQTIQKWSNNIVQQYGGSLYLVGSALWKENPRDIDLRLLLPDADFEQFFGSVQKWIEEGQTDIWSDVRFRWSKCCTELTRDAWSTIKVNIDFQIYPISWVEKEYRGCPKMLLNRKVRSMYENTN